MIHFEGQTTKPGGLLGFVDLTFESRQDIYATWGSGYQTLFICKGIHEKRKEGHRAKILRNIFLVLRVIFHNSGLSMYKAGYLNTHG